MIYQLPFEDTGLVMRHICGNQRQHKCFYFSPFTLGDSSPCFHKRTNECVSSYTGCSPSVEGCADNSSLFLQEHRKTHCAHPLIVLQDVLVKQTDAESHAELSENA